MAITNTYRLAPVGEGVGAAVPLLPPPPPLPGAGPPVAPPADEPPGGGIAVGWVPPLGPHAMPSAAASTHAHPTLRAERTAVASGVQLKHSHRDHNRVGPVLSCRRRGRVRGGRGRRRDPAGLAPSGSAR